MQSVYEGRVEIHAETALVGRWALPVDEYVAVGRAPGSGLRVAQDWVPSRVCRFMPYEVGWLVQFGRARGRVSNKYLGDVVFGARTVVALQPGRTRISFPELDDVLDLRVVIGAGEGAGLPVARDVEEHPERRGQTRYQVEGIDLPEAHRQILAVAFEHLMPEHRYRAGRPGSGPANIAAHAAARLPGKSEQAVKNVIVKTRNRINNERWLNLQTTDQLGEYLVRLTGTITPADLPEGLPG